MCRAGEPVAEPAVNSYLTMRSAPGRMFDDWICRSITSEIIRHRAVEHKPHGFTIPQVTGMNYFNYISSFASPPGPETVSGTI
jgi:hypothetical protein